MVAEPDPRARLIAFYQAVAPRLADLPIYNPALAVEATPFRLCGRWRVGVLTTPWFMNVTAVANDPGLLPPAGAAVILDLPAGEIEAVATDLDGFGRLAVASLFSPMDGFATAATARVAAEAALEALFGREPPAPPGRALGRRALFAGARPHRPS